MKEYVESEIKKSKKLVPIGIFIIILGLILMITPVSKLVERGNEIAKIEAEYEQSMAEYEQAHEEWLDSWWKGGASFEDAPEMPTMGKFPGLPVGTVLFLLGSIIVVVVGVAMILMGNTGKFYEKALDKSGNLKEEFKQMLSDTHENNQEQINPKKKTRAKAVKCENCGATKKGSTCEYCGE